MVEIEVEKEVETLLFLGVTSVFQIPSILK